MDKLRGDSGNELWTSFAETAATDAEAAVRFRLEHLAEDHEVNESMLTTTNTQNHVSDITTT